jgi:hypothetical protein
MTPRQQMFAIAVSIVIVLLVFELVRRKRLREEYTWLWMLSAVTIFLITASRDLLMAITHLIGAVLPTTTVFLFGILFLYLICLHACRQDDCLERASKKVGARARLAGGRVEGKHGRTMDGE